MTKKGLSFDLSAITVSQAFIWASRTDLGVLTTLTPCLPFISMRSVELRSIIFQVKSADSATDLDGDEGKSEDWTYDFCPDEPSEPV